MSFDRTSLASMSFPERADRLRPLISDQGGDALLVTNLTNVRYLTSFTGSAALLAVLPERLVLVTDGRYQQQAQDELTAAGVEADVRIGRTADEQRTHLADALGGLSKLCLEADSVTWSQKQTFADKWFPQAEMVATTDLVAELRAVKDEGEIARIQAACAMADAALAAVRHRLTERPTEAEVGLELEWQMRRLGADGPSFETIVASGPNGARPHHRAGQRRIDEGDLVVIDFGALLEGYHSDMTRTLAVGEISPVQERMWQVVREAQSAGLEAIAEGAEAKAVDDACREVIRDAGWEEAFLHGTGHGVGLDIHEGPRVSASSAATLTAGHVITVEPGVYLPDHGGVRIEDTVVVTAAGDGGTKEPYRILTRAPKDRDA